MLNEERQMDSFGLSRQTLSKCKHRGRRQQKEQLGVQELARGIFIS